MRHALLVAGLVLALTVPTFGDVTIKQATSGKGMGVVAGGTTTTYIKGMKMRSDVEARGTVVTTIFDVENQKLYMFDSKKKSADVWDMQAFSAELAKSVETGEIRSSIKANGKTKEIAGKTANGYDMRVTVPATMGGEGGMEMTVQLSGPMWVVRDAPGTKDYMTFYKAAAEKGWIFSDPRAAKGSPGQAKAMAEMQRQLASIGGLPYETEMNIAVEGEGPMAAVMAKMGGMSITTTTTSVDTSSLDDALFAPPAGYKLVQKK
ncbi:MAG TPA: hypothetical protein VFO89_16050 [Thermoanaerobaculia bacterium]|nr:hypothetical protein [Thermoanaerobaculia bacterium]